MRRRLLLAAAAVVILVFAAWLIVARMLASDLVREAVAQQLSQRLGEPVHIKDATATIFPRAGVDLHEVTIGTRPAVTLGRVELRTGFRGLLSHRIANADVVVADGRIPWPLPFPVASASPEGGASSGVTIVSINRIALENITIVSTLPPLTIDLDAALRGDRLDIAELQAKSGNTRLDASGVIDSTSRMHGTLTVKGAIEIGGYDATDLSASVAMARDTFILAPLTFNMFGGRFQGRLTTDLRAATPALLLSGDVSHVDVAEVMERSGAPGDLTGTLGGRMQIRAAGSDGAALLRSARGNMTVQIVNGTIPHLNLVRAVVLAFGKPDSAAPAGSGSAFESLSGPIAIADATLSSDSLTLRSRDFDMIANVRLRLDTGAVDGRANVVLSRELTAQAGTDLRRYAAQDGRVILPVTISGTLSSPTVFVDLAAAAKRALGNEVKRRLGDLLGGFIRKKGGG